MFMIKHRNLIYDICCKPCVNRSDNAPKGKYLRIAQILAFKTFVQYGYCILRQKLQWKDDDFCSMWSIFL